MRHTGRARRRVGSTYLKAGALLAGCLLLGFAAYVLLHRTPGEGAGAESSSPAGPVASVDPAVHAAELFGRTCAPCHGDKGDGAGPAARFLYPKPRNFGEARFRLVSTTNFVPSEEDLVRVITRGMPGSAMFAFGHLPEAERVALAGHVRRLTQDALVENARAKAGGRDLDLAELRQDVAEATKPGEMVRPPEPLPAPSSESVARGQKLFIDAGCVSCHGATGKGDGVQDQKDDSGVPTRPRDFTRGIFKGGRDPEQLYARVMLGMPGTPMPASRNLTTAQAGDLINFVLSLSDAAAQAKVEHQRREIVADRASSDLPTGLSDAEWRQAPAVPVVVTPLWWRTYAEPDLKVQALHDGSTLAVRLTWHDETRDDRPIRPQDFEDMAAVQWFKSTPEPFLGMGAGSDAVDVWLWRAGWTGAADRYADVETVYPNMAVDLYPFEKPGTAARPHPTENQAREYLTAQAAGNLRSDPTLPFTGNSLQAKGFGSLTMRPRTSQAVSAAGRWQDGRWTVVLRRPLAAPADGGIGLAPGDRVSVAFALWDGAARDRNGQKLVSIWHDLRLK